MAVASHPAAAASRHSNERVIITVALIDLVAAIQKSNLPAAGALLCSMSRSVARGGLTSGRVLFEGDVAATSYR